MPNYLVRLRENHEAVGFFAVQDLAELLYWIDEITEVAACEYAEIGSGSVIFPDAGAMKVPASDHDWDGEERGLLDVMGPHDLGGNWPNALFDEDLQFTPCLPEEVFGANDNGFLPEDGRKR